jgi:hypothetical protein
MASNDARALARQLISAARQGGVGAMNVAARYPGRVGAMNVAPRYVGAPAQAVQSQAQQPILYSPDAYTAGDVTWYGLGQTIIVAGAVAQPVFSAPIKPFVPQKLLCVSTVVGLLITAVDVGGTNLWASALGVPIELFSEVSTAPQIDWPTLDPANGITFTVANPTAANLVFSGAMYGTAIRR